ncbi:MAG TPA: ATP-binding protein [Candidatus Binatia bacterium]|nr:ATP-binding protein [Candidatus Binatia bacterium]
MKPSLVARLMLAYAAVIAGLLVSTWWSQRSLAAAERAAQRLAWRSVQGIDLTARLETVVREKSRLADYLLAGDRAALDAIRPHRQQFQAWIDELGDFARTDPERALIAHMRGSYAAYTSKADEVIRRQQAGDPQAARAVFVAMAGDVEELLADGQQLLALAEQDMRARRRAAEAAIAQGRSIVLWLTAVGALFSLVLGFVLSRYAARPIYRLVLRLGASGVVDRVEVDGDELGTLEAHVTALLERVRQQERALQQAEKLSELGEIASEIAHETLNPVSGVKAMLQALRRTALPPERLARELSEMERQLGRVADTVRRLMCYARPLEPKMAAAPVRRVVDQAVRTAELVPATQGCTIRTEPVPADLRWEMDPELIEQVLVNLIVNACEASPPGGEVEVRAAIERGELSLVVRDHGPGISPAIRERLFHPFFTTKPHGNGLGLAVSRNIVREHGGQIDVGSTDGGGSAFRVLLPAAGALCVSRS